MPGMTSRGKCHGDLAMSKYVNHFCIVTLSDRFRILPIDMNVTMKVVGRFKASYQPVEGLNASVGQIVLIVDLPRRRVGGENVKVTPVKQAIQ